MVEKLFGGKLPVVCDKPAFSLSHRIQRFSLEKTLGPPLNNLGTICEGTDELCSNFSSCSSSCSLFCNDSESESGLLPLAHRKTRAMSLPVIYRDGSYLKLETHIVNLQKTSSSKQRRFSAPSRPSNNFLVVPTIPEPRQFPICRKSTCQNQISDKNDNPLENILCASYKSCNTKQFRRHSDPLPFASFASSSHCFGSVPHQSSQRNEQKTVTKQILGPRRKSSVVPVPFSMPLRKKISVKNRPKSFPPAKDQQEKIGSLKRLEAFLPENLRIAFGNDFATTLKRMPLADNPCCINVQEEEKEAEIKAVKEEELNNNDFYSRTENIVQWIKFFG